MFYDKKKLQWVLSGIVSFGQKRCGTEGYPAVYVNVTNYMPWIDRTISERDDEDSLKVS
jgi:secreted trypsin-like serine protease